MFDYEKADLAVVKALSKAPLTLEEIEQLLEADRKFYSVDQGLDHIQTQAVKAWARSEALRCRAHILGQAKSLEDLEESFFLNNLPLLTETHEAGRMFDYEEGKSDGSQGRMAKQELFRLAEYSTKLHELLHDNDDLPEWCLKYIYLATAAMAKVHDELDYKIFRHSGP